MISSLKDEPPLLTLGLDLGPDGSGEGAFPAIKSSSSPWRLDMNPPHWLPRLRLSRETPWIDIVLRCTQNTSLFDSGRLLLACDSWRHWAGTRIGGFWFLQWFTIRLVSSLFRCSDAVGRSLACSGGALDPPGTGPRYKQRQPLIVTRSPSICTLPRYPPVRDVSLPSPPLRHIRTPLPGTCVSTGSSCTTSAGTR